MSKSIRVTLTRPDLSTEPPWSPAPGFLTDTANASDAWKAAFPGNPSYLHVDNLDNLNMIIDHIVTNDADLETHRTAMMALLPWWKNATNASAVDAYMAANNLTFAITEVDAPTDTSGYIVITDLSSLSPP